MVKQENSKEEEVLQDKYNKITIFLTKFVFGDNFELLKKTGYVDSYASDPEITNVVSPDKKQRFLFMLFKDKKKLSTKSIKNIISQLAVVPIEIVFSYDIINDYFMVVINFPEQYIQDYDSILQGKYSKLSDDFKKGFPSSRDVFNSKNERVGKEHTIYHHIFNKTDWLKEIWMKKLNLIELDDKLELWSKPDNNDLTFNIKTLT